MKRIEKELGREATLRLLWPYLVGSQLAANTELKAIRGAMLVVGVPDRGWLNSLQSLKEMILQAVNRVGSGTYDAIELIEQPHVAALPQMTRPMSPATRRARTASSYASFDASAIADEQLRKMFAESAGKYLAMQSQGRKGAGADQQK